jgi:hypothetical protein
VNTSAKNFSLIATFLVLSFGTSGMVAAEVLETPEESGVRAAESRPRATGLEGRVAILGGTAAVGDANVTATYQCFLCVPVSASRNITFEDGNVAGLRVEAWVDYEYVSVGLGLEWNDINASSITSSSGQVSVSYTSFSLMPMLRYAFFRTPSMSGGRFSLYAGLALSSLVSGSIRASFPELPVTVKASDNMSGNGGGAFAGVSVRISDFALFLETRAMDMDLSGGNFTGSEKAKTALNSNQMVLGVAYTF